MALSPKNALLSITALFRGDADFDKAAKRARSLSEDPIVNNQPAKLFSGAERDKLLHNVLP